MKYLLVSQAVDNIYMLQWLKKMFFFFIKLLNKPNKQMFGQSNTFHISL